jgi:hypothetical protein
VNDKGEKETREKYAERKGIKKTGRCSSLKDIEEDRPSN